MDAPAANARPGRFWSLDVIRGLCALAVFLTHWHRWSDFSPRPGAETAIRRALEWCDHAFATLAWPTGGNHPAVICFFVLSGFCIHLGFVRQSVAGRKRLPWRTFYNRRFLRIAPVYWTAVLLGFAIVALQRWHPVSDAALELNTRAAPASMLARLLGLTDFYPVEVLSGNGPIDTVGIEILLYSVYPAFHFLVLRGHWVALGLGFIALELVGITLLPHLPPVWVYNSVLMCGALWYAGAFAAWYFVSHGSRNLAWPLVLAWGVFLLLNAIPHFYGLSVLKQNVWGVVCTLGILQCLHLERLGDRTALALPFRAFRYLGRISYSLYAVHAPALFLGTWLLLRWGHVSYPAQLLATFGCAITGTLLMYYGIERLFYQPANLGSRAREVTAANSAPAPQAGWSSPTAVADPSPPDS